MAKKMGIDFGSVRIGIAVSDETGTIAFGRNAVKNDSKALNEIINIVSSEDVTEIIIGYPLNLKSQKTQQTIETENFAERLKQAISKAGCKSEIKFWDERFTSKMAADSMLESGMKKKKRQDKSQIDIISSALMLQSYLDSKK